MRRHPRPHSLSPVSRLAASLAVTASLALATGARAEPSRLESILDDAAAEGREVRITGSVVSSVVGLAGLVGGVVWASDGDTLDHFPGPTLLIAWSGSALVLGIVGLATTSDLEDLAARLDADPGAEATIERDLEAAAASAHTERITGGVIATVVGAGLLVGAVWVGLEEDDPGVAFLSSMGLGLGGSLCLGGGIGLLANTSLTEDAARDVRAWRRSQTPTAPREGLHLEPPRLQVGPGGLALTLDGTF